MIDSFNFCLIILLHYSLHKVLSVVIKKLQGLLHRRILQSPKKEHHTSCLLLLSSRTYILSFITMPLETRRRSRSASYSCCESSTCVFDLFFDIPHPAASSASCERAKIIEPPGKIHPDVCELYHPSKISKIPKFAFPDFDENNYNGKFITELRM